MTRTVASTAYEFSALQKEGKKLAGNDNEVFDTEDASRSFGSWAFWGRHRSKK
uniref:Uncharacterized protein n=1 Tax=Hyaloperonospora arabidopsidis (strain Emoy2) TaxID=559515 RepID=M4C3N1_HYAAE